MKSKSKFWKVPRKWESHAAEEKKSNSSITLKGIRQSSRDVRKSQLLVLLDLVELSFQY